MKDDIERGFAHRLARRTNFDISILKACQAIFDISVDCHNSHNPSRNTHRTRVHPPLTSSSTAMSFRSGTRLSEPAIDIWILRIRAYTASQPLRRFLAGSISFPIDRFTLISTKIVSVATGARKRVHFPFSFPSPQELAQIQQYETVYFVSGKWCSGC